MAFRSGMSLAARNCGLKSQHNGQDWALFEIAGNQGPTDHPQASVEDRFACGDNGPRTQPGTKFPNIRDSACKYDCCRVAP